MSEKKNRKILTLTTYIWHCGSCSLSEPAQNLQIFTRWIFSLCLLSVDLLTKRRSQVSHLNGFSRFSWNDFKWYFKFPFFANVLLQIWHVNPGLETLKFGTVVGSIHCKDSKLSLGCFVRKCWTRLYFMEKKWSQQMHLNFSLSVLCVLMCLRKYSICLKVFVHKLHSSFTTDFWKIIIEKGIKTNYKLNQIKWKSESKRKIKIYFRASVIHL